MKKMIIPMLFASSSALAAVQLPVQGQLTDNGAPVTGPIDLEFRLVGVAGDLSCEAFTSVPLIDGVFTLTLGAGDGTDCGSLLAQLDEALFAEQGLTIDVTFNGQTFEFPVGEAGRAGFAVEAESAQLIGGLSVDQLARADARVFVAQEGALAQALVDAGNLGGPALVRAGPGTHTGTFQVPANVTLRGSGRAATTISGSVVLANRSALESLAINAGDQQFGVVVGADDGERIRITDVDIDALGANLGLGIIILNPTNNSQQSVDIDRVAIRLGGAGSIGIQDENGATLNIRDSRINSFAGTGLQIGVRIGAPTEEVSARLRMRNVEIEMFSSAGFVAGVEINGLNGTPGSAIMSSVDIRAVDFSGSSPSVGISNILADTRIYNARIFGDFSLNNNGAPAGLRVANSGMEAFSGTFVQSGTAQCRSVVNESTFAELGGTCT